MKIDVFAHVLISRLRDALDVRPGDREQLLNIRELVHDAKARLEVG